MAAIRVGGKVQLITGGPIMAVDSMEEINGVMTVWCSWFDEKNKEKKATYPLTSLKAV
jgi:uncharacterized protein YodC (DUF2158 family)